MESLAVYWLEIFLVWVKMARVVQNLLTMVEQVQLSMVIVKKLLGS